MDQEMEGRKWKGGGRIKMCYAPVPTSQDEHNHYEHRKYAQDVHDNLTGIREVQTVYESG